MERGRSEPAGQRVICMAGYIPLDPLAQAPSQSGFRVAQLAAVQLMVQVQAHAVRSHC